MNVYYNSIDAYVNCVQYFDTVRVFFKHKSQTYKWCKIHIHLCILHRIYVRDLCLKKTLTELKCCTQLTVCKDWIIINVHSHIPFNNRQVRKRGSIFLVIELIFFSRTLAQAANKQFLAKLFLLECEESQTIPRNFIPAEYNPYTVNAEEHDAAGAKGLQSKLKTRQTVLDDDQPALHWDHGWRLSLTNYVNT